MIAFRREYNDAQSVIDIFNDIYNHLGRDMFMKLFPVILTDNGPEFSNPEAIEFDEDGNRRTYMFYCHPVSYTHLNQALQLFVHGKTTPL